ncbi:PRAME family member 12-like [Acomys russatus]|uniref:PRAME family member 12-like n=1 Tax=Acomys russatus TaxID=60746 RepID=UPI0021E30247|nr:PRAME family member 12-like [Acomys russatus]
MSVQTPPTLLKLARQALQRDEALAICGLRILPVELLPDLFKEALTGRQPRLVRAIVATWPFPRLPVGAWMETPDLETFQAVLAGIDIWLTRKSHPRGKLQVLDLRKEPYGAWSIWAAAEDGGCSEEPVDEMQVEKVLPRYALRPRRRGWPLKVVADLCLRPGLQEEEACFLQWAQQRQGSLQLCCEKMQIWAQPVHVVRQVLNLFPPEHISDLELNTEWGVYTLAHFAPCLGQMRNLRRFSLAPISQNVFQIGRSATDREEKCVHKLLSQFSRLKCLQHLSMTRVHFLRDRMSQALRCLKKPLETLRITHHRFPGQTEFPSLAARSSFQLKHLHMRGVVLRALDGMALRVLLKTWQTLCRPWNLTGCKRRTLSSLSSSLPLSKCCQLTQLSLYGNEFSRPILGDLLQHTAHWSR